MDYSKLADEDLVEKAKKECDSGAISELYSRHEPLIYRGIQAVFRFRSGQYHDMEKERMSHLWNAIQNYDSSKGQFNTFVFHHFRYESMRGLSKMRKEEDRSCRIDSEGFIEEDDSLKVHDEIYEHPLGDMYDEVMGYVSEIPDDRIRSLFLMRYGARKASSWHEIGEAIGLSHQGAINLHDKILSNLKKKLKDRQEELLLELS